MVVSACQPLFKKVYTICLKFRIFEASPRKTLRSKEPVSELTALYSLNAFLELTETNGYYSAVHGEWFTVHGEWFTVHGEWFGE